MIKKHKKTLFFSSLLTLFPIFVGLILWNKLPQTFATHWGIDGQPDGWSSTATSVFLLPLIMLAVQWLCIFGTSVLDKSNRNKNEKVQKLMFWIIPFISNFACGTVYAIALGKEFAPMAPVALMGILFILMGNYMPKTRMNATIGIKIPWTYSSEENWNATHRFAGKVWVLGGIALLFSMLLPDRWTVAVMLLSILILVILPVVYSIRYYRMQKARGEAITPISQMAKKNNKVSLIFLVLILVAVSVLMFTGEIEVFFTRTDFTVNASWYSDLTVDYDAIESIEYREGNVAGTRVWGWGSAQLLLGTFENEEFGNYTRYTYTRPEACIVVTSGEQVLVLSGRTAEDTEAIYRNLLVLTENP